MIRAHRYSFLAITALLTSFLTAAAGSSQPVVSNMKATDSKTLAQCPNSDKECLTKEASPTTKDACRFLSYCDPETGFKICADMRHRPEAYYVKSTSLLSNAAVDQGIYSQTSWDLTINIDYKEALWSKLGIRTNARWGTPELIKTTLATVPIAGINTGSHRHAMGRHLFWIREGWFKVDLNEALCLDSVNKHYLRIGAVPFQLGRGISLGSAFAVTPGIIGFYTDDSINQYPWGVTLTGDIVPCTLSYDLYFELARNLSDSFGTNAASVFSHTINPTNKAGCAQRGFGTATWVLASRLNWKVQLSDCWSFGLEPYALYANHPEQKVDISPDANLKMGTLGMALTIKSTDCFEFGIEGAFNMGRQQVLAIDKNQKEIVNRNGALVPQYTKVLDGDPDNDATQKALVNDANTAIIDSIEDFKIIANNSQQISDTGLYNSSDRFRAAHKNKLRGRMMISDFGYKILDKNFKIAGTFGYASGDHEHPNTRFTEGEGICDDSVDVQSFVSLQELYAGSLVQSIFLPSIPRSFSINTGSNLNGTKTFGNRFSGFTNLILAGGGVHWFPQGSKRKLEVKPNIIFFWQPSPPFAFNFVTGQEDTTKRASTTLGTEVNLFTKASFLDDTLKFFFVGAAFFPGQHFRDVKGKPLSSTELALLNKLKDTSDAFIEDQALLGHATAISLNFGFEYIF